MKSLARYLCTLSLLSAAWPLSAQPETTDQAFTPLHPSQLAAESDLVALVQLDRTNYQRRRDFPVSGDAWVQVLLPYKVPGPTDRIKIVEEGFGDDRCYFPEAPLWAEAPRFLMFLKREEDGRDFEGHRGGCMLEVAVTTDNRYAVRWPQDLLVLDDDELDLIEELQFAGPGAMVDLSEETRLGRERMAERYFMVEDKDQHYRYTRGIPLEVFRERILGSENLTRDRQLLGR